jgi:hypothetical protein
MRTPATDKTQAESNAWLAGAKPTPIMAALESFGGLAGRRQRPWRT